MKKHEFEMLEERVNALEKEGRFVVFDEHGSYCGEHSIKDVTRLILKHLGIVVRPGDPLKLVNK